MYDFINFFMSVLFKRPGEKTVPEPAITTVAAPAVIDPLDEIMVDPVTKLKITSRQWEAMGTTRKSVEVSKSADANYEHKVEKRPTIVEPSGSIAFPPLPKESKVATKSKGFTFPQFRFGSRKRKDE
ncbi:hypothetical protein [Edwardsiella tarda]|uniref:hypothetical protein n=1 Tax=Edwardsiella tarda TaxID=636 RepID=UPI0011875BB0|nr:hypothetical protein [Edwardsiella tarda]UBU95203.1 hypothetical protein AAW15_16695 [Edwardsiella tarda]